MGIRALAFGLVPPFPQGAVTGLTLGAGGTPLTQAYGGNRGDLSTKAAEGRDEGFDATSSPPGSFPHNQSTLHPALLILLSTPHSQPFHWIQPHGGAEWPFPLLSIICRSSISLYIRLGLFSGYTSTHATKINPKASLGGALLNRGMWLPIPKPGAPRRKGFCMAKVPGNLGALHNHQPSS